MEAVLSESFKEFSLTPSQTKALGLLENFFGSEPECFLLKGYAGTGKTFLIAGLVNYLKAAGLQVVLAAPTGRASRVLAAKTGFGAVTIHRFLYSGELLRDVDEWQGGQYDMFKVFYGTATNPFPANAVFIADEASLISDAYSDNDTLKFGTGHLLNDFVRFVFPAHAGNKRKIIFVGDPAQLPPVDMSFSPALDGAYLLDKFGLRSLEAELTDVVRQQAESLILKHATTLRQALSDNLFNTLSLTAGAGQVLLTDNHGVVDEYLSCAGASFEDALVIAHSNAKVYAYNQAIRSRLFPGSPEPRPGDRLVVMSNNYLHGREILNGEIGTIVEVNNAALYRHKVRVRRPHQNGSGNKEVDVELVFRQAVVRFQDTAPTEGKEPTESEIRCMILDNLLFSPKRELDYDETVALLVDFKNRFRELGGNKDDFRTALRGDPFFNALRVKFGYAVTCHKAQGGEWKQVFVDCATSMGYHNNSYFRWLYTAITRASQRLMLINVPSFHPVSGMKAVAMPEPDDQPLQERTFMPGEENAGNHEQAAGEGLLTGLDKVLTNEGYKVSDRKEISYGLQMKLLLDDTSAVLRIFYNKNGLITKTEIMNFTSGIEVRLRQTLINAGISKETIRINAPETGNSEPGAGKPDLSFIDEFEQRFTAVLQPNGITLVRREMHDYQLIFYLERGLQYAAIKFYYNKKQQFTRFEIIEARSSGMTEELNSLIEKMTL